MRVHLLEEVVVEALFGDFYKGRGVENKGDKGAIGEDNKWENKVKFFVGHHYFISVKVFYFVTRRRAKFTGVSAWNRLKIFQIGVGTYFE